MKSSYWQGWRKLLTGWILPPLACAVVKEAVTRLPFSTQMKFSGLPNISRMFLSAHYLELINTQPDEEENKCFYVFLNEVGV